MRDGQAPASIAPRPAVAFFVTHSASRGRRRVRTATIAATPDVLARKVEHGGNVEIVLVSNGSRQEPIAGSVLPSPTTTVHWQWKQKSVMGHPCQNQGEIFRNPRRPIRRLMEMALKTL